MPSPHHPHGFYMPVHDTIEGQLKTLLSDVFGVHERLLDRNTELDILEMDELEVRELVSGISAQFCVDVDPGMIGFCETLGELTELVTRKAGN